MKALRSLLAGILLMAAPSLSDKPRIALCFYGLTRSLHLTVQNLRANMIDPLIEQGLDYDVYLHTYNASQIYNPMVGEINLKLRWEKYELLKPHLYQVHEVQAVDELLFDNGLNDYLAYDGLSRWQVERHGGGPMLFEENITVMNMVKALWSAQQCAKLIEASSRQPTAVVFLRSDVWFFNPINASIFLELQANRLYVPDWAHCDGLNDRFALGNLEVALKWGNRLDLLKEYCREHRIFSEHFLWWAMTKHGVDITGRLDIFFERVRANGHLHCCDRGEHQPCGPQDDCYGDVSRQRALKAVRNSLGFVELTQLQTSR